MKEFKVEDVVKIRKDSKYYIEKDHFNPKCYGRITRINSTSDYSIIVEWNNGNRNVYNRKDLELVNYSLFTDLTKDERKSYIRKLAERLYTDSDFYRRLEKINGS